MEGFLNCFAMLAAIAMFGANVPQNSADKYYFTVPAHPAGIKGKVLGDPPAYHMMRSEDIAWINEAAAERRALITGALPGQKRYLVPEFGRWPLSATNGFRSWTTAVFYENDAMKTNIVVRYAYKTNDLSGSLLKIEKGDAVKTDRGGTIPSKRISFYQGLEYIMLTGLGISDPTESLIANSKVYDVIEGGLPSVTNIETVTVTNWTGWYMEKGQWRESVRTNVSYITMQTANGGQSVYTNRWTEIMPRVETAQVTNIVEGSLLGMIYKNGAVEYYEPEKPRGLEGTFKTGGVKAWYDVLAKAKYNIYYGNSVLKDETEEWTSRIWPKDPYGQDTVTNTIQRGAWGHKSVEGARSVEKGVEIVYEEMEGEGGETYDELVDITPKEPEEEVSGNMNDDYCSSSTYDITTPLLYGLVHTGGVSRIKGATLFAIVSVSWHQDWRVRGRGPNGEIWNDGYTNVNHTVAVRLGEVQEINGGVKYVYPGESTTNSYVAFRCNIGMKNLLESAATLSGHAFPSYGFGPSLKEQCPDAYIDKPSDDPYEWDGYAGYSSTHEIYNAGMTAAVLVIEFQPWTSLSGW